MNLDFALIGWQGPEIVIIVVVVLLLFGATAIPKLARALGKAKGEFSQAKSEFDAEVEKAEKDQKKGE